MKALVQRVKYASVDIDGRRVSEISRGLLIFLGVMIGDTEKDLQFVLKKCAGLRIFDDAEGRMNLDVSEVGGEALVVSQFTLAGNVRKGNRPSYVKAASHDLAVPMYEDFCRQLSLMIHREVKRGVFGANMQVSLLNDGPVTIIIDSRE